jgi:hypothetical protein
MYGHSPNHDDLISSRLMKIAAKGRQITPKTNSTGQSRRYRSVSSGITAIPTGNRIKVMRKSITFRPVIVGCAEQGGLYHKWEVDGIVIRTKTVITGHG